MYGRDMTNSNLLQVHSIRRIFTVRVSIIVMYYFKENHFCMVLPKPILIKLRSGANGLVVEKRHKTDITFS